MLFVAWKDVRVIKRARVSGERVAGYKIIKTSLKRTNCMKAYTFRIPNFTSIKSIESRGRVGISMRS